MNVRVPTHVEYRVAHDEVVLLDTRSDAYVALNPSASLIWATLADGGSAPDAADLLADRFSIERDAALADVAALVDDLIARGLLDRIDE